MAATGSMIDGPMAVVETVNSVAIPSAEMAYTLMYQILQDNAAPLIFASLPISAAAIIEGLAAYEATLAGSKLAYGRIGLDAPAG